LGAHAAIERERSSRPDFDGSRRKRALQLHVVGRSRAGQALFIPPMRALAHHARALLEQSTMSQPIGEIMNKGPENNVYEIYQSTKALSVYNVLSQLKIDLPRERIDHFLRTSFDVNLADDYVSEGIAYLVSEGFAEESEGVVKIQRMPDGTGKPVVRSADDRALVRVSYEAPRVGGHR
jgi:hypothetical protein